MARFFYF